MPATNESPAFDANRTTTLSVQENTPAGENIGDPFTATDNDDTGDLPMSWVEPTPPLST